MKQSLVQREKTWRTAFSPAAETDMLRHQDDCNKA
jgi:hypothetical protein